MESSKCIKLIILLMFICCAGYAQALDQTAIDKQVNYLNSQIKKNSGLDPYSAQVTVITASQYESQKPADAVSFDCGYLDDAGKVFVSEPVTDAQKKIFTNVTQAAVFYVNQSFLRYFFQIKKIPMWFRVGFAAFEADLNISDAMIKDAIEKYGGTIPAYATLNNKALFETNNGIAISYLWGEMMNVSFGWWKYCDIDAFTDDAFTTLEGAKTPDELLRYLRRFSNMRILETVEKFRVKLQGESDHFKYYYRDNESYCMPYMQNALEDAYTQYSGTFNIQSPKKLTYSFQPECEGAKFDSIPCPGRYTGGTAWVSGVVTSCAEKEEDLWMFKNLVRHELSHLFQFLIKPNYMPAWLSEGFACILPDGIMNEQAVRNESGFACYKIEYAYNKIGHYPTLAELEDYGFMGANNIDYYLFGLLMNDFIIKKGGYGALASIIKSNGQDFSSLGYSTKQQFETGFYDYYNSDWKSAPKQLSVKKVSGKPRIDGNANEPVWEKNIILNRKFYCDGNIRAIPSIDNSVAASMLWDEENLYIAMDVTDASISSVGIDFLRDGIEVDIDPDLSRGIDFKDNDMAFIWSPNSTSPAYKTSLTGANVVYLKTVTGYSVEISIPWSKLGITPSAGTKFGLELCNYDMDNSVYQGTYVFSGHSWEGGAALNGMAEITLSAETSTKACQLVTPNGGDVFIAGETETIDYNAFNVSNIKIEFSSDNGATWSTISANTPVSAGGFNWVVPNIKTEAGKIRITDVNDNTATGISANTFRIVSPASLFGPYISDANTMLLMHFNNNLQNKSAVGNGVGSLSYTGSLEADLGQAANPQSEITVPHNSRFNLTGDFTIEAWVKLNSYNQNGITIITKPGDTDLYFSNYTLEINPWWGNVFHGFCFDQGKNRTGVSGFTPELNKWYHIAYIRNTLVKEIRIIVHDAAHTKVYTAGQNYTEPVLLTNSKDIIIGSGLDGYIDELRISNVVRDFSAATATEKGESVLPAEYSLMQNYPNPFNPSTVINYTIPVETSYMASLQRVTLKVYDLLGREVATLVNEAKPAGTYSVKFDASSLPSGIYLYRLTAGTKSFAKKMILMK
jgi:hypothetical protein